MEFTSLRYFFETAKTGSIRQAAEHIHVAPSAISRQIAKLEHELGAPLFERRSSGVKLTPAGELLASQLQSTVRDLMRVRGQIDDLKGLRRGDVAIYCIEGLIDTVLPGIIAGFNRRYPEIRFQVIVSSTDRIIEAVVADDADIGIALNAPRRPDVSICGGWEEPIHAIVASAHSLSGRKSISIEELAHYPAVLPDRTFGVRRLIDRILDKVGRQPSILVTTNSILTTICIARQGIAYTLMPMFAVEREIAAKSLVAVPLTDDGVESAKVQVCVHRHRRLPLAALEFLRWLDASLPLAGRTEAPKSKRRSGQKAQPLAAGAANPP
jgi:DNA-binding transcriptional LysR family regulator